MDLSGVFGMPLEETLALVEKAREDLTAALHASLIAQNHWKDCPSVSALTESWPLSPQTSASLVRHVASCPVCGARETPPLPPDRLLSVLPIAAIPAELRLDVLTAATAEDRAGNRRAIAAWTEPFDEYGWPLPYQQTAPRARDRAPRRRGPVLAAVAVGVGVLVLFGGAMAWLGGGNGGTNASATGPASPAAARPVTRARPSRRRETRPHGVVAVPERVGVAVEVAVAVQEPVEDAVQQAAAPPTTEAPKPPTPGDLSVSGCDMGRGTPAPSGSPRSAVR